VSIFNLCPACGHVKHMGKDRCGAVRCVDGAFVGEPCSCTDAQAAKADAGKAAGFLMLPYDALAELAEVYSYGEKKYKRDSWRQVPNGIERYYDALQRHLGAWTKGEERDQESGLRHLAHALWNMVALVELTRKP
jgi:hypothetical protein